MNDAEREALERRIDELCQEVEQLRKQLHDQQDTAEHNFVRNAREYKRVCDENDKLRKLLLDVWNDATQFDGFWDYVHDDGEIYDECVLPHYQERMRELGIEVD